MTLGRLGRPPIPRRPGLPPELCDEVDGQPLACACNGMERAPSAELTAHLGYEPHQEPPGGVGSTR